MKKILVVGLLAWWVRVAVAGTTADTDFLGAQSLLTNWVEGTLGDVIGLSMFLVGMAIGVKTGKLAYPFWGSMCCFFGPSVIETVFGGVV